MPSSRSVSVSSLGSVRSRLFRLRKATLNLRRLSITLATVFIIALVVAVLAWQDKFETGLAPANLPFKIESLESLKPNSDFNPPSLEGLTELQMDVRQVTAVLYNAYLDKCLGKDEFVPASSKCENWFGIGLTLIDSLDTLLLMRLDEEYEKSRQWAAKYLSFANLDATVSMFEINIRAVAGLNSAYQLTGDKLWLAKSVELADYLILSFNLTNSGCPPTSVYVGKNAEREIKRSSFSYASNPAEAGTLQLEFRTLTEMTGDKKYAEAVDRCTDSLISATPLDEVVTDAFSLKTNKFIGSRITIGAMVDSYYEMLVKTWVAFGKRDEKHKQVYERAVEAIYRELVRTENNYTYVGIAYKGHPDTSFRKQMEHLTCFFPGNLAYAALHGLGGGVPGTKSSDYLPRARELAKSCYAMSRGMFHGMAAEVTDFYEKIPLPARGAEHNLIRPEIVEALYYLDKIDPLSGRTFKEWGENMWKGLREYAQVPLKDRGILSSTFNLLGKTKGSLSHGGKLHSFAIAETFKYFYLLFDEREPKESAFPLDKWVYNTEAHPVRIVRK